MADTAPYCFLLRGSIFFAMVLLSVTGHSSRADSAGSRGTANSNRKQKLAKDVRIVSKGKHFQTLPLGIGPQVRLTIAVQKARVVIERVVFHSFRSPELSQPI